MPPSINESAALAAVCLLRDAALPVAEKVGERHDAVQNTLGYHWNNGIMTEGHINRLKMIKRSMVRRVTHCGITLAESQEKEEDLGVIWITWRRKTKGKAAFQKRGGDTEAVRATLRQTRVTRRKLDCLKSSPDGMVVSSAGKRSDNQRRRLRLTEHDVSGSSRRWTGTDVGEQRDERIAYLTLASYRSDGTRDCLRGACPLRQRSPHSTQTESP